MNVDERAGRKSWNGRPEELARILEEAARFVREHPRIEDMSIAVGTHNVVLIIYFEEPAS